MSALPVADSPLLALLAESALAVEGLAAGERRRSRSRSGNTPSAQQALLAIELRLKLEEQVLLPRIRALGLPATNMAEQQIELLRELLAEAGHGELAPESSRLLWAAIERMSILHFDAVAQLTSSALADSGFDADAVGREAEDYRLRWRDEIADSGGIEDEEADPVGQPPR